MRFAALALASLVACGPAGAPARAPVATVGVPSARPLQAPPSATPVEPAAKPAEAKAMLHVASAQPDVMLTVDDREPAALPRTIELAPGEHALLFGGTRYAPKTATESLAPGELRALDAPMLQVAKGKATISLATPGAIVLLERGTDRRELPMLPIAIDFDTGASWTLRATKRGYCDFVQPIDFSDGVPEKTIEITLRPGCRR